MKVGFPYKFPVHFGNEVDISHVAFKGGSITTHYPDSGTAELAKRWEHPVDRLRRIRRGR